MSALSIPIDEFSEYFTVPYLTATRCASLAYRQDENEPCCRDSRHDDLKTMNNPRFLVSPFGMSDSVQDPRKNSGTGLGGQLPLNLIAHIISFLDDVADLARLCRTSRVLHYMCLPQLYHTIVLTSYNGPRYRRDGAQGLGSASPFAMGLNAIASRNTAKLVRSLTLQGEWKEYEVVEHARAGRIPDNAMMLNIAVRAAIDRCEGLESFTWDLNTKLLPAVYTGLSSLTNLRNLRIRNPSTRIPRPIYLVTPMPQLHSIVLTDIDPLCYPDDFSLLFFSVRKLKHLTLHFSPRMRLQSEPSVQPEAFFKRFAAVKRKLEVESVGVYHILARRPEGIEELVDLSTVKTMTDLRAVGDEDDESTSFMDDSWKTPPATEIGITTVRTDFFNVGIAQQLLHATGKLQRVYLVNRYPSELRNPPSDTLETPPYSHNTSGSNSSTDSTSTSNPAASHSRDRNVVLRDAYLNALIETHGSSLIHLALPTRWPLSLSIFARLVRGAPNLTQLSLAVETDSFASLRLLVPFLQKLRVLRLLIPTKRDAQVYGCIRGDFMTFRKIVEQDDSVHIRIMGREMISESGKLDCFPELKYVVIGWKAFELGDVIEVEEPEAWQHMKCGDKQGLVNDYGTAVLGDSVTNGAHEQQSHEVSSESSPPAVETVKVKRRAVKRVPWEAIHDIEIFKMDSLDVIPE